MKRIHILFLFCANLIVSCMPDLDLSPLGSQSVTTYYKTAADANAAVISLYGQLRAIYRDEVIVTPNIVSADDGIPFPTGNANRIAIWNYNITTENTFVGQIWSNAYTAIQRSNIVISRVPGTAADENIKRAYLGEAYFLRALHYFNLVRFFGGVPVVTGETTSLDDIEVARAGVDEVYDLIEADLLEAVNSLPAGYTGQNVGRATKGAAAGLLAKVYLTRAGNDPGSAYWKKAADRAKEVIDSGLYGLWDDYSDVFALENRGGKESLFEIMYLTDVAGNNFSTGYAPRGSPIVPGSGSGILRPSKDLFELYTAGDKRKPATFLTEYVHPVTGQTVTLSIDDPDPARAISFWKLADQTSVTSGGAGKSFPFLRYSDILLIYAEAVNRSDNGPSQAAYNALNQVRQRAGLAPLSGLTVEEFNEAVLTERRLELCFEGHRWFDLVRTGRLVNAVKTENSFSRNAVIEPFHVLFPIPQREMDANAQLSQNQGY
ncbi:MAG: glycan metabolism protein [Cytophagaceae bacterium SCN 52-12]|nr:MAG: glycan metabolism protein [Cytophagaceae bacterium SCN 52-12]